MLTYSGAGRPSDYGTGHFCVFVEGIEELYRDLLARGVRFRSDVRRFCSSRRSS